MVKNSKIFVCFMSLVLMFSMLSISTHSAAAQSVPQVQSESESLYDIVGMEEETFNDELDKLIVLLEEMDSKGIDIVNLENNNPEQINLLSKEARELYTEYEVEINNSSDDLIGNVQLEEGPSVGEFTTMAKASGIYISNATVKKLNEASGWSGGVFGVAAALIKMKLGLSPTALTLLIIAVASLGMKGINSCNKYKKGFYLKGEFYGSVTMPVGTVTCSAKK